MTSGELRDEFHGQHSRAENRSREIRHPPHSVPLVHELSVIVSNCVLYGYFTITNYLNIIADYLYIVTMSFDTRFQRLTCVKSTKLLIMYTQL